VQIDFNSFMTKENTTTESGVTREQMIQLLNEDLAGEYQAIIAYTVYSQVLKGAAYTDIARELSLTFPMSFGAMRMATTRSFIGAI
jgi:bacterioferritin (cytochrome b1)